RDNFTRQFTYTWPIISSPAGITGHMVPYRCCQQQPYNDRNRVECSGFYLHGFNRYYFLLTGTMTAHCILEFSLFVSCKFVHDDTFIFNEATQQLNTNSDNAAIQFLHDSAAPRSIDLLERIPDHQRRGIG